MRRFRPPDAIADGSVVAGASARGPVLCKDLARTPIYRSRLRAGLLRWQRPDAVLARIVWLRDVLGCVSVHLDQTAIRRRTGEAGGRSGRGSGCDQPHPQSTRVEPVARATAVARRVR